MNRQIVRAIRCVALGLALWHARSGFVRGQQDANHEAPRPVNAPPSIYARASLVEAAPATPAPMASPSSLPVVRLPQADGNRSPIDPLPPAPIGVPAPVFTPAPPAQNSMWTVSTRRLPYPGGNPGSPDFAPDVQRFVPGQGWTASSFNALLAEGGRSTLTTIFIHGNDTDADFAMRGGAGLNGQLIENLTGPAPPTRFVIWSWPNEGTTIRVRKTTRASAARLGIEGYFLACCLSWVAQQGPTSLVGYSSGAGIVTGALHVLGGGALEGRRLLAPPPPESSRIHAVLLGAATPNDWLLPGMPHERAWTQLERLVVTVNPNDAVLHWYPMLWGRGGPTALGATGVVERARLGPMQSKLVELDLRASLNRNHGWKYYSASPEVANILRHELIAVPASRGPDVELARQPR